jgi:folate-binding protein YgfZ
MVSIADTERSGYAALVEGAGLVDRSERGKLALTGREPKEFLHGQVTNDVEGLVPGLGCYAAFLDHKGRMQGDLRILDAGDEILLDCERGVLQELFNMIRRYKLGRDVELHKRTLETGLLSLIGPEARAVAGADALPALEHAHVTGELGGAPVRLVATDLADALVAAGAVRVEPAVAEIRRVETGRPRWGLELDTSVIPQEAGLNDRAVNFQKGCYVGQETVARLFYRGKPNRHLRGLRLSGPAATGDELRLGERVVGQVATVADSPALGWIALALVRREAEPGAELAVGDGGPAAVVAELPLSA